jgi:hypothetical protein
MVYEFNERTIRVVIDRSLCPECETKACVKACSLYDRGILIIKEGIPFLREGADPVREGTECLACEEECRLNGFNTITVEASLPGLEEYKKSHNR